ncbi:hypothetical protein LMG24076_01910 [Trinickia soli]|jgi:hypothetical protein|nr:hypothetical protein LMG24076_01910 [Trinickia soli]
MAVVRAAKCAAGNRHFIVPTRGDRFPSKIAQSSILINLHFARSSDSDLAALYAAS